MGDRLDAVTKLVDAWEAVHFPMAPPGPIEAINFRIGQKLPNQGTT